MVVLLAATKVSIASSTAGPSLSFLIELKIYIRVCPSWTHKSPKCTHTGKFEQYIDSFLVIFFPFICKQPMRQDFWWAGRGPFFFFINNKTQLHTKKNVQLNINMEMAINF